MSLPKMLRRCLSLVGIILATLSYSNAFILKSQPQFTIKTEKNKAFNESCLIGTLKIENGNIADCLEHCLENCRCQSFQICQNTKCQLCSSHKEENSSLLHDKNDCIYATYEARQLSKHLQKLEDQCLDISCLMKYNCCQQSGLCRKNEICKPVNSLEQPWKRFTCECPDGYRGDNCDQPIRSCAGYLDGPQKSGMHKILDSENSLYEAYCNFQSGVAWTLVQSYSYTNGSSNSEFQQVRKSLCQNHPLSENSLTWSGYRFSKARMESIKNHSNFLQFTCDYEKYLDMQKLDYAQIELKIIPANVLACTYFTAYFAIGNGRGEIGNHDLNGCKIKLHQSESWPLHVHIDETISSCNFNTLSCSGYSSDFFGSYYNPPQCIKQLHRCLHMDDSTTQLWFGMRKEDLIQQNS